MRDNVVVGIGKLMPSLQQTHGRQLKSGWVAVEVLKLHQNEVRCWDEFPTHSDYIEEGSFCAWPETEIEKTKDKPTPVDLTGSCVYGNFE